MKLTRMMRNRLKRKKNCVSDFPIYIFDATTPCEQRAWHSSGPCTRRNFCHNFYFTTLFWITFDWNGNNFFWWYHWKDLVNIYENIHHLNLKKKKFIEKNVFVSEKYGIYGFSYYKLSHIYLVYRIWCFDID